MPDITLQKQIRTLVAQALQAPEELVTPDLAFGDLPQWDSLGHMDVVLLLEEQFGIAVDADTIARLVSIPEIYAYLQEHNHVQSS